jgi:hypothetical protein
VRVHELESRGALRTRLDVSRARGFSRFVGRADETAALEGALARAIAGQGQVVGVVAEPGVGKSRLCYEFTQGCRTRGIRVNEAHAVAHGKMIPFLPMLELLRDIHGVTEHDSPQAAREKIAGRLLLLDEGLRDGLPIVFDFLGVPDPERPPPRMEAEARQRRLFAIVKCAVQARSRREPAVTLIEDLHWLDGGSEVFLEMLVEATTGTRTLLLLNFRPDYHAEWMQGSRYQQLPLLPLGAEAAAELLRDLLGSDAALVPLAALIQERTAGNPFFAEEVVQALVESGVLEGERGAYRLLRPVAALAIPASVQAVLAARIDRLREREKTILQTAAVIGSEFAAPVLERVAELPEAELAAALRVLVAAEFVYEEALYPEAVYAFKHPLTQEVAYRSQLAGRRARVHAAAARAIEATAGGKLDEHAALLAYHWEGAGEAATAAEWHRRAAVWLGARDRRQTLRHWREVRRLLDGVAESPEVLALGIEARAKIIFDATVVDNREDEIARCFAEGSELARRLGNPFATVRLHVMSALNRFHAGEIQQALAQLFEVLSLADASGDVFLRISVRGPLIAGLLVAGRLRESAAIGEELEQLLPPDPDFGAEMFGFSPRAMRLAGQALNRAYTGRLLEVAPTLDAAFEIARRRHDGEVLNAGHHAGMILAEFTGDAALAATHARQAAEVAEMVTAMNVSVFAGRAHLLGERYAEAIDSFARAVSWFRERRISLPFEPLVLASLAEAQLGAGDPSRARATAEEAVKAAHRRQTPLHLIPALLARAWTLLATDDRHAAAEVEAALAEATALVEETEARAFTPFIHVERAALARLQGNDAIRQRELREAHRLFTEMGAPIRAEQVLRQLERH